MLFAQQLPQEQGGGPAPKSTYLDSMHCHQRPPPVVLIAALQQAKTAKCRSWTARTGVIQDLVVVCFVRKDVPLTISLHSCVTS